MSTLPPTDSITTQTSEPRTPTSSGFPPQHNGGHFSQSQFRKSALSRATSTVGFSPHMSRNGSMAESSISRRNPMVSQAWFHSRRVKKGDYEKPWMAKIDPKQKWISIIPLIGVFVGFCLSGVYIYFGISSIETHKYCPVLIEEFGSSSLDTSVWTREVEVGGFGYNLSNSRQ
jgi:hypothetical protein